MEAQKLGGFDMLILASSWIFWVASLELPTNMLYDKIMIIEHNLKILFWGEVRPLKASGGVLGQLGVVLGSPGSLFGAPWADLEASWGGFGAS